MAWACYLSPIGDFGRGLIGLFSIYQLPGLFIYGFCLVYASSQIPSDQIVL